MPLTKNDVKRLLRRKGWSLASYARWKRKTKSWASRLASGEIGGQERERFAHFLGVAEKTLPKWDKAP